MVNLIFLLGLSQAAQPGTATSTSICVDKVRGEANIGPVTEDAVSASFLAYKGIKLLEDCTKAEYVVRGSIVERSDIKSRTESEDTGVASGGITSNSTSASGGVMAARGSEAISSTETKRSVTLSLKVVSKDGEVVFAGMQDSTPSRNRSAISEAAEKLSRQLVKELFPVISAANDKSKANGYQRIK